VKTCSQEVEPLKADSTAELKYPWAAAFFYEGEFQCIGHLSEFLGHGISKI
jgi:hypothetical protein